MENPLKCYICDIENSKKNHKNVFNIKSQHSRKPIADLLKKLQNGDEIIGSRSGSDTCVICVNCIDKLNAYDAACLLVKQVEGELKTIIEQTEKRYRIEKDPIKIDANVRSHVPESKPYVVAAEPFHLDEMQIEFDFGLNDENNAKAAVISESEDQIDSIDDDFDSDDSFVWPKHNVLKRRKEKDRGKTQGKKKRRLYKCIECPGDYNNINDMQVIIIDLRIHS